jgi:hypothetical protein
MPKAKTDHFKSKLSKTDKLLGTYITLATYYQYPNNYLFNPGEHFTCYMVYGRLT